MKGKLSIKGKLTLYYGFSLFLVLLLTFLTVTALSKKRLRDTLAAKLENAVLDAAGEIEFEEGDLDIYDDDIHFLRDNIYISVWDGKMQQLGGYTPGDLSLPETGEQRLREQEGWLLYDVNTEIPFFGIIWVRGCLSLKEEMGPLNSLYRALALALPLLLFTAVAGCYGLTRRVLLPVRKIAGTARQIGESGDLSKRIGLQSADEFGEVAGTFDGMLERLEGAFLQEKRFSADASHELRTPISLILGECELGLESAELREEALLNIKAQGERMNAMLHQLLLLSRSESAAAALQKEEVDLSLLLESLTESMEEAAGKKGIRILSDIPEDCIFFGDETLLLRLFMNLLDNAVRYGKEGGFVRLSLEKEAEGLLVRVEDDGRGISEEGLSHIFERFYRDQGSGEKLPDGTGLGLSLCAWIAKAHGGSIRAESRLGEGSRFTVELPLS